MAPVRIAELTWPEYQERVKEQPVIVPVGATEQHGLHLPLGADAIHAEAVALLAAERSAKGALVTPVFNYGYKSHPHTGGGELFPGTISLDAGTLISMVSDVLRQLMTDGAKRIMMLSGHFENSMMLHEGIDLSLRHRQSDDVTIINLLWVDLIAEETLREIYPGPFPGVGLEHAAFLETSILLHLRPDLVHPERASTEVASFPPYDIHPQRPGAVPASGSLTRSTGADAASGKRMVDEAADGIARVLDGPW